MCPNFLTSSTAIQQSLTCHYIIDTNEVVTEVEWEKRRRTGVPVDTGRTSRGQGCAEGTWTSTSSRPVCSP
ncbi:hypothetical protein CEXT_184361 [Caerostris extrusa]|uniref:Uncharacterized protein n=1 Tax=Caerostris extrusa TaxID=172846 RepID=A0AAV4N4U9_CAEEX|nr:hypothetical protein CEXT_184361 [Caerostris extrusa]